MDPKGKAVSKDSGSAHPSLPQGWIQDELVPPPADTWSLSQVWEVMTAPSIPCKSQILLLVLIPGKLWDMENTDLHNGLSDGNTGILLKTTPTSGEDNSQRSGPFK